MAFRFEDTHWCGLEDSDRAFSLHLSGSVSDVHMLPDLLHGEEKKLWGDASFQGQD